MKMLIEIALILAVIVWAAVYLVWRVGFDFRRNMRAAFLYIDRDGRRGEDEAWATHRHAEYEHAMTLTLQRAELQTVEALVEVLRGTERWPHLDVVA